MIVNQIEIVKDGIHPNLIIEDRIEEIVSTFPKIIVGDREFQPSYDFGSHAYLLRYMEDKLKEEGGVSYPLVWLETPVEGSNNMSFKTPLKLLLATLTKGEMSNKKRLETTFKDHLFPLLEFVKKGFEQSGFTRVVGDMKLKKHFNYLASENQEEQKNFSTDIWDVITVKCEVEFNCHKLKTIYY